MKVNWIVLAIVAAVCFFVPGGFLAASGDRSGAGMVALGYMFVIAPPILLGAVIAQVVMINSRFRAYPTYVLAAVVSSLLGVMLLVS